MGLMHTKIVGIQGSDTGPAAPPTTAAAEEEEDEASKALVFSCWKEGGGWAEGTGADPAEDRTWIWRNLRFCRKTN